MRLHSCKYYNTAQVPIAIRLNIEFIGTYRLIAVSHRNSWNIKMNYSIAFSTRRPCDNYALPTSGIHFSKASLVNSLISGEREQN